jgi:beta-phosphoglucomutase-like phosphatase (HAD superfamily)
VVVRTDSNPAAVLFDFNGVLVDDEHLHWRAFRDVLAPLGLRVTRRLYDARYLAFDDITACRAALREAGITQAQRGPRTVRRLVARKRRLFMQLVRRHRVGVGAGAARLLLALAGTPPAGGLPVAVVSSATRVEIEAPLRRAGLRRLVRVIVAAEDVHRCKPDPEGYRLALRRLGSPDPGACVAIEDSPGGIAAARAAGLGVLGVATSYPAAALRRAGAFAVVPSLRGWRRAELLIRGRRGRSGRRRSCP